MVKCMNACKNYQKMIKDYDEGRLSLKQEEKFINHIIHCNDCKEELEIYYIVSYGLDENYDENKIPDDIKNCIDSYDFKTLVELKLKKSIEQCKMMHAFINIIMVLMFIVCIIIRFY